MGADNDYLPAPPTDRFLITRTFGEGLKGYKSTAFPHVAVLDMDDASRVEAVARWAIRHHGVQRVVAIHEKDMLLAARLREDFDLPGMNFEATLRFRDKVLMKDTLALAGYQGLPRYRSLERGEVIESVPWTGRIVVKSRWGVGSSDVRIVGDIAQANEAARELERRSDGLEVEEFIDGTMYHCDAVVHDGQVLFSAVSEYIAAPGQYGANSVAGSVLLEDGALKDAIRADNALVLRHLGLTCGVTHVEYFHTPAGRLVFCEAAARPGGGGIDDIVFRGTGVNLIRAAIELQSGVVPHLPDEGDRATAVFGIVGMYHSDRGQDTRADDLLDAIPGVLSYQFATPAVAGTVRHCTDYGHKLVIGAETRERFDDLAARAVRFIRGDRSASAATTRGSHAATS
ncbi:hypothetical protein O7634_18405 [Micromonospora sp. WMMD1120]|uniref:ATP-grasp domain-containing protein n=1 Tax=Micromonospora sp. WMMD1120 TaxID=3016106 RepID=UPI002415FA8D|nr:hypothetical protein [Micromonospora sp. WMMD1120]MDG4808721.1 hypothetical protein [Micromonospora sp. WMMD1120]